LTRFEYLEYDGTHDEDISVEEYAPYD